MAGYERVAGLATEFPQTRLVYAAFREFDMIELLTRAGKLANPADWLLRAPHDAPLPDGQRVWRTVDSRWELGGISLTLPAKRG